jgi:hypothetical protein
MPPVVHPTVVGESPTGSGVLVRQEPRSEPLNYQSTVELEREWDLAAEDDSRLVPISTPSRLDAPALVDAPVTRQQDLSPNRATSPVSAADQLTNTRVFSFDDPRPLTESLTEPLRPNATASIQPESRALLQSALNASLQINTIDAPRTTSSAGQILMYAVPPLGRNALPSTA